MLPILPDGRDTMKINADEVTVEADASNYGAEGALSGCKITS